MNAISSARPPGSFLFLQGMATRFFRNLGEALSARGHAVRRITFNGGDWLFWPNADGEAYRGKVEAFAEFLKPRIDAWGVTDIVLFGDCRPLHREAIALARVRNIRVHVIEEGYLRPNWITAEPGGVNGHSALPKDPDWYLDEAKALAPWTGGEAVGGSFSRRAVEDVVYNIASVVLAPLYPGYRTHRPWHPFVEYAGWLKQLAKKNADARDACRTIDRLIANGADYYVHPLQLDCDSQIRFHSSFGRIAPALEHVIASFARRAPTDAVLVIKEHPLDNGLQDWRALASKLGREHGVESRLAYIVGGDLDLLLRAAKGVVTVNSTAGFMALSSGRPVIALGEAIYDMPRMTFQGELDAFWTEGEPPSADLFDAFRRVVADRTQVNGGFFSQSGLDLAVANTVARLEAAPQAYRGQRAKPAREPVAVGG